MCEEAKPKDLLRDKRDDGQDERVRESAKEKRKWVGKDG